MTKRIINLGERYPDPNNVLTASILRADDTWIPYSPGSYSSLSIPERQYYVGLVLRAKRQITQSYYEFDGMDEINEGICDFFSDFYENVEWKFMDVVKKFGVSVTALNLPDIHNEEFFQTLEYIWVNSKGDWNFCMQYDQSAEDLVIQAGRIENLIKDSYIDECIAGELLKLLDERPDSCDPVEVMNYLASSLEFPPKELE